MKVELKLADGTSQAFDALSLLITLSNGETLEVEGENENQPVHLSAGVTLWGGRIPQQNASLQELKASTRGLGVYPLAANIIHIFPLQKV